MIFERQRLCVLHAADALEVAWIDRENPAGTERVRIAGARLCRGRRAANQPKDKKHYTAHKAPELNPRCPPPTEAYSHMVFDINGCQGVL
jgi:hypothetical protein